MHHDKITVYSALVGTRDNPRTDDVLTFSSYDKFKTDKLNAKIYKVLPHMFLSCDYSIWIDANVTLLKKPEWFIEQMTKDVMVFANPYHKTIRQEADYIIAHALDKKESVEDHMARLNPTLPVGACYLIVRRHTQAVERANEKWWAEICRGSARDQLSFSHSYGDLVQYLPAVPNKNDHFIRRGHKN